MPYAGYCRDCPVFVAAITELGVYTRLNKHKRETDHHRFHPKVWKVTKVEFAFYAMNYDKPWFKWFVDNRIVRNIPPSPEALRHYKRLPIVRKHNVA